MASTSKHSSDDLASNGSGTSCVSMESMKSVPLHICPTECPEFSKNNHRTQLWVNHDEKLLLEQARNCKKSEKKHSPKKSKGRKATTGCLCLMPEKRQKPHTCYSSDGLETTSTVLGEYECNQSSGSNRTYEAVKIVVSVMEKSPKHLTRSSSPKKKSPKKSGKRGDSSGEDGTDCNKKGVKRKPKAVDKKKNKLGQSEGSSTSSTVYQSPPDTLAASVRNEMAAVENKIATKQQKLHELNTCLDLMQQAGPNVKGMVASVLSTSKNAIDRLPPVSHQTSPASSVVNSQANQEDSIDERLIDRISVISNELEYLMNRKSALIASKVKRDAASTSLPTRLSPKDVHCPESCLYRKRATVEPKVPCPIHGDSLPNMHRSLPIADNANLGRSPTSLQPRQQPPSGNNQQRVRQRSPLLATSNAHFKHKVYAKQVQKISTSSQVTDPSFDRRFEEKFWDWNRVVTRDSDELDITNPCNNNAVDNDDFHLPEQSLQPIIQENNGNDAENNSLDNVFQSIHGQSEVEQVGNLNNRMERVRLEQQQLLDVMNDQQPPPNVGAQDTPAANRPCSPTPAPAVNQPLFPRQAPAVNKPLSPRQAPAVNQPHSPRQAPAVNQPLFPRQAPAGTRPLSPRQAPAGTLPLSPRQAPAGTLPLSPRQAPAGTLPLSPRQAPAGTLPLSPRQAPAGTLPLSPRQAPAVNQPRSPRQAPAVNQPLSPRQAPAGNQQRSPIQAPAGTRPLSPNQAPAGTRPLSPRQAPAVNQRVHIGMARDQAEADFIAAMLADLELSTEVPISPAAQVQPARNLSMDIQQHLQQRALLKAQTKPRANLYKDDQRRPSTSPVQTSTAARPSSPARRRLDAHFEMTAADPRTAARLATLHSDPASMSAPAPLPDNTQCSDVNQPPSSHRHSPVHRAASPVPPSATVHSRRVQQDFASTSHKWKSNSPDCHNAPIWVTPSIKKRLGEVRTDLMNIFPELYLFPEVPHPDSRARTDINPQARPSPNHSLKTSAGNCKGLEPCTGFLDEFKDSISEGSLHSKGLEPCTGFVDEFEEDSISEGSLHFQRLSAGSDLPSPNCPHCKPRSKSPPRKSRADGATDNAWKLAESDNEIPDVMSEMLRLGLISEPFPWADQTIRVSDTSVNSDYYDNLLDTVLPDSEMRTDISSGSPVEDLSTTLHKLGLSWAASTVRKTQEASNLNSSSSPESAHAKRAPPTRISRPTTSDCSKHTTLPLRSTPRTSDNNSDLCSWTASEILSLSRQVTSSDDMSLKPPNVKLKRSHAPRSPRK